MGRLVRVDGRSALSDSLTRRRCSHVDARLSVFAPSQKPKITPCLSARLSCKHGPYLGAAELLAAGARSKSASLARYDEKIGFGSLLGRWTRREARGVFWVCACGDLRSRGKLRVGYLCYFCRATTRTRRTRTGPAPTDFTSPLAKLKTARNLLLFCER